MNNLSSYCWLVDAKIRASDKDLPVMFNNDILYPSWFDEFFRKCYDKQKVMKSIFFAEQLDFLSYSNKYPWNLNTMSVL